ncbi:unnamed protein product, partial [Ilex paraguariensis]
MSPSPGTFTLLHDTSKSQIPVHISPQPILQASSNPYISSISSPRYQVPMSTPLLSQSINTPCPPTSQSQSPTTVHADTFPANSQPLIPNTSSLTPPLTQGSSAGPSINLHPMVTRSKVGT